MKNVFLVVAFCCCFFQPLFSQSEAVVSLALPIRNSLKYNRYLVHPSFSFAREQGALLTFYNKRQWVSFDNAPQTYLVSYSGRFRENEGVGLGLFQQNYGVLTTFGAVANFAHNIVLQSDSNLTFGVNLGFYKSGLNRAKVITNFPDPILETIPSNSFLVLNPGINYSTTFLDFGVAANNVLLYNLNTSQLIKTNSEKSISVHLMHTGYLEVDGFFDESKFSALIKSDFRKDQTILSGLAMLSLPAGIWTQLGYNTVYGISGGLGVNISQSIALEYNYERGLGDFTNFGASHEIVLAYKFKNRNYNYNEDEQRALISPAAERRIVNTAPKEVKRIETTPQKALKTESKPAIQPKKSIADAKPKSDSIAKVKQLAEAKAKNDAKIISDSIAKEKLVAEAKAKTEAKIISDSIAKAKQLAEAKAKNDAKIISDSIAKEKLVAEEIKPKIKDRELVAIENLALAVAETKNKQKELLGRLTVTIAQKEKALLEMKEENDLSEKGIFTDPKPFKSTSAENGELELLKTEIAEITKVQKEKIRELEKVYADQLKKGNQQDESLLKTYSETIQNLKSEHLLAVQSNVDLNRSLDKVQEATEVEKKRRIKRASFINNEGRYAQDMETLKRIKETTVLSAVPLQTSDFDSGEEQPEVQIVKAVKNVVAGYYLVIAVHNEVAKRDEFLTKTVASGQTQVNFFYDANSSKYFIYYDTFDTIEAAKNALKQKGNAPYNNQIAIVKIEN